MPFPKFTVDFQERPTLPSIHALNLPLFSRPKHTQLKYQNYEHNMGCSPLNAPNDYHHSRQVSTSSSHMSVSRTISPSPSPNSDADSQSNPDTGTKLRLVPCPLETADAVILIPPPEDIHHNTPNYVSRSGHGQGLLLFGPALHHVRQPQRQLAKGARIHPYRVVRGENTQNSRRSSVISITSFSHVV